MWYKFKDDEPIGIPRAKYYHVAFYDMINGGECFDETFYSPNELDKAIHYIETVEDKDNYDRTKIFVHFDNGDIYELKLEKVNIKHKRNRFND